VPDSLPVVFSTAYAICGIAQSPLLIVRREDGAILCASPAACERFGWSDAMLSRGIDESVLWAFKEQRARFWQTLSASGCVRAFEAQWRSRRGETLVLLLHAEVLESAEGSSLVAVTAESRRVVPVERELDLVSKELAVVLRTIGDGVITTDGKGRVLTMNAEAVRLTDCIETEAVGRPLREVFKVTRLEQGAPDPFSDVVNRRQDVAMWPRATLTARDGTQRQIAEAVAAVQRADGDGFGVVIVIRDMTTQARLDAELERNQRLESVSVLAAGTAHDLSNILLGILGHVGLALQRCEEEELHSRLLGVDYAARHARNLTQQLLGLSHERESVRVAVPVAKTVRDAAEFSLAGSAVECMFSVGANVASFVVDPYQIGRVIQNVVRNAAQAQQGKGPPVRVDISLVDGSELPPGAPGSFVCISVSDSGPGIPTAVRERMFEAFFTTKPSGTGLGLPVAKLITSRHGGFISVDSREGRGTTVGIYIPTGTINAGEDAERRESLAPSRVVARLNRGRLLLVEDDDAVAEIVTSMCQSLGWSVVHARCEDDAVRAFLRFRKQERPFEMVLIDLNIGATVGGCACLARLRELGCHVPAILSTGSALDPEFLRWREFGFDAALPKPYSLSELRRSLDEVLEAHRLTVPPSTEL